MAGGGDCKPWAQLLVMAWSLWLQVHDMHGHAMTTCMTVHDLHL